MDYFENVYFNDKHPQADPIWVSAESRIIRFALNPGQKIEEHQAPNSPLYILILRGNVIIGGGDGNEQEFGENSLLIFEKNESHSIKAGKSELVFIAFMSGVSDSIPPENVGGILGRQKPNQ